MKLFLRIISAYHFCVSFLRIKGGKAINMESRSGPVESTLFVVFAWLYPVKKADLRSGSVAPL